jgi:hypothetical protein
MQIAGQSLGVAYAVLLVASVGVAGSRTDLGNAAEQLAKETRIAAAHGDTVSQSYATDAQALARSAERFRSDVETQTVSDAKVSDQFQRVAGFYKRFKDQVKLANTQQAFADLKAVNAPYRDVERQLGVQPEDDRGE